MHAAASLQFKEGVGFRELRRWQTKLAFQRIQKFNQDFNVPVIIGLQAEEETGAHSHALRRHPFSVSNAVLPTPCATGMC